MTTTLTISADEETLRKAEEIAASMNTDVPTLVNRYLRLLIANSGPLDPSTLAPITRSLYGILKDLPDKPYKELVAEALAEKYGLDK